MRRPTHMCPRRSRCLGQCQWTSGMCLPLSPMTVREHAHAVPRMRWLRSLAESLPADFLQRLAERAMAPRAEWQRHVWGKGDGKGFKRKGSFKGSCWSCGRNGHRSAECRTRAAGAIFESWRRWRMTIARRRRTNSEASGRLDQSMLVRSRANTCPATHKSPRSTHACLEEHTSSEDVFGIGAVNRRACLFCRQVSRATAAACSIDPDGRDRF